MGCWRSGSVSGFYSYLLTQEVVHWGVPDEEVILPLDDDHFTIYLANQFL